MFNVFINERLQRRQDYFDQEVEELNIIAKYEPYSFLDQTNQF